MNNSAALLLNPDFVFRICLTALQTSEKESLENSAHDTVPLKYIKSTRENTAECSSFVLLPVARKMGGRRGEGQREGQREGGRCKTETTWYSGGQRDTKAHSDIMARYHM